MKKTQKTMIAVLLAMLLVGCSAQEPLPEAEVTLPEVTAQQVAEAHDDVLTTVTEETTPVAAAEETEPASEATEPELQETVPAVKAEEREQEKPTPKPQPTEPKETAPVETKPAETKPVKPNLVEAAQMIAKACMANDDGCMSCPLSKGSKCLASGSLIPAYWEIAKE